MLIEDQNGNFGFNKNFLKIISATSENYISICNQDDVRLPENLTLCLSMLKQIETPEIIPALMHCDAMIVDSNLNLIPEKWISKRGNVSGINGPAFANSVQGASTILNFNIILKRFALTITPEIPYDYHLPPLSAFKGRRYYINEPQLKHRQHNQNVIGALGSNKKINFKYYINQLHIVINDLLHSLQYKKLTPTLQSSLIAYYKIKNIYVASPLLSHQQQSLQEYLYIFEGSSVFKKLFTFLKNQYVFSRKKYYLVFLVAVNLA